MRNKNSFYTLFLFFCILKIVLQFSLVNSQFELHRDEFLHLDQANHLAWGYYSVPPFTSWIALLIKLLGGGVFWIRFFPALFGCITLFFVLKCVAELGGRTYAVVLAGFAITFSALLRLNILFQPNSADIMFWTASFYFIVRYIRRNSPSALILLGISIGLGFLNKYNIIFQVAGLIPAMLLTRHRKILLSKHFYYAIAVCLIIVLPNLIWQVVHHFPVIYHMRELKATQLVNVDRVSFMREQALYFFNSDFILLAAFVSLIFSRKLKKYNLLLVSAFFTLIIFIALKGKAYYAIGIYPIFLAFGAVFFERYLSTGWKFKIRYALPLLIIALYIPVIKFVFPVKTPAQTFADGDKLGALGLLRWEDGKNHQLPQDFADMLGWKELSDLVLKAKSIIPAKEHTLIIAENYGQAGAINSYGKNLGALSYNADYLNWFPENKSYRNIIMIRESQNPPNDEEKQAFDETIFVGKITNKLAREYGTYIYILKDAKIDIAPIIENDIAKRRPK